MVQRYRRRRGGRPHVVLGLLLVGWGLLALFDGLGLVELRTVMRTFWPLLIIAWGLSTAFFNRRGRRWFGVLVAIVGTVLLGNQLLWWRIPWSTLWPVLLIAAGLRFIFRRPGWSRRWPEAEASLNVSSPTEATSGDHSENNRTSPGATLREMAIFGGIERRNVSQAFRGGEVTAVLGGVQLDLRDCRMAGSEAHIELLAMLGGVSLTIPRDWTVESEMSAILGGVDDRSVPPVDGSAKRLVLTGQAFLGGVEIKN